MSDELTPEEIDTKVLDPLWYELRAACRENNRLRAERDAARALAARLAQYGTHHDLCMTWNREDRCGCGLSAALADARAEGVMP